MSCMDLCLCLIVQYILLFINVLNTERAKRASTAQYELPDRFALTFFCCLVSDCKRHYNYVLSYKKQDDVHPKKRLSL